MAGHCSVVVHVTSLHDTAKGPFTLATSSGRATVLVEKRQSQMVASVEKRLPRADRALLEFPVARLLVANHFTNQRGPGVLDRAPSQCN